MSKLRISYVDPSMVNEATTIAEFERCARDRWVKVNSKPARQAAE